MVKKQPSTGRGAALLQELKALAERLGIRVREEKLLREVGYQVRGGSCRVRGQEMVFLDRDLPLTERVEILLDALARHNVSADRLPPPVQHLVAGGMAP